MLRCFYCLAVVCLVALSGCLGGGRPGRVSAPGISGSAPADAIKKNDKNADGALDDAELIGAPGILHAKTRFDKNSDGKVTEDEIADRIQVWKKSQVGLTQYSCSFTLDGRPLEGATVKFVPEDWLGPDIKGGSGTTDTNGRVSPTIAEADLKPDEKVPRPLTGMRLGIYKLEVTHPTIQLPARYNTATEIGVEITSDDPDPGRTPAIPLLSR